MENSFFIAAPIGVVILVRSDLGERLLFDDSLRDACLRFQSILTLKDIHHCRAQVHRMGIDDLRFLFEVEGLFVGLRETLLFRELGRIVGIHLLWVRVPDEAVCVLSSAILDIALRVTRLQRIDYARVKLGTNQVAYTLRFVSHETCGRLFHSTDF